MVWTEILVIGAQALHQGVLHLEDVQGDCLQIEVGLQFDHQNPGDQLVCEGLLGGKILFMAHPVEVSSEKALQGHLCCEDRHPEALSLVDHHHEVLTRHVDHHSTALHKCADLL